ncbi:MAG: hypothetical protein L0Y44_14520 [Phycisphaerales bacterium]|nr:hypothetical protein [Phycisphaerales bacterium]MCI0631858.1 hypothetical protein [Phycisphaerales bacterium]MCI0674504.1 hypothetical protein [Phycisphaerales bacterium]
MTQPLSAVLLAGRIRSAPFDEGFGLHVLGLPLGPRGTLLDTWVAALSKLNGLREIKAVVNTAADVESVQASQSLEEHSDVQPDLRIVAEPAPWRGAAGILRDVTRHLPETAIVIACEAKRLPLTTLQSLMTPFRHGEAQLAGVVGIFADSQPAGVYAFRRTAIDLAPPIGYYDMKEQFLPALARHDKKVVTAQLTGELCRLSDLDSYLIAVRKSLANGEARQSWVRISPRASVSGSAVLDGFCVVEDGAVIEDGAVVHDSVILRGATVGGGAVVSECVAAPLAVVEPRSRVVRQYITGPSARQTTRAASPVKPAFHNQLAR